MGLEPAIILFVDDEALVRRVLGDALISVGHKVQLAASGEEALAYLERGHADLLLLDLQLGDIDGMSVMRTVRRQWPKLPIVILTAHGSLPSAIEAIRHEVADYLLKPVSVDELRRRVADVLDRHRQQQQRQDVIKSMYTQLQNLLNDGSPAPAIAPPQPSQPATYSVGPLHIDVQQHFVRLHGQAVELTPTEFSVLHELIRQPGVVVPCTRLVAASQHVEIDEEEARQVIRPHIVRLRRKIEENPQNPIYIQSVRGIGYRWGPVVEESVRV